ncbi:LysR family transcriptional regulator [Halomonas sp. V046]|uniref:LysR family transcriptional regulator n=1 Tax=Halomonas sp. V046 TaxID=3459611 RepID=UPI004043EE98
MAYLNGISLDDIVAFAEVARHRSLRLAAERLNITSGAISRRLDSLERRLGVRLLHRTTRAVRLTAEGSEYLSRVSPAVDAIACAGDHLSDRHQDLGGEIRISLPVNYARLHIAPHLADFLSQHPNIRINAIFDDGFSDIVGDGFDLAIRIGRLDDSRLVARRIASDTRIVVASPDYLQRHGTPTHPLDLLDHACLHYTRFHGAQRWVFAKDGEQVSVPVDGPLRANYGHALTLAAEAGLGFVHSARAIVLDALESGRLVEVLGDWRLPQIAVYAITPARATTPRRVNALIDHIASHLPQA